MKLAFVSLMAGVPWGGSEALWHAVALHALERGDEVFVSVYDWNEIHEKVRELINKGAKVHFRKRYHPAKNKLAKIKQFIINRKPSLNKDYQEIIQFKPDAVLISQGDSFELATHNRALYFLLKQHSIKYSFICHNHSQYSYIPNKDVYPFAKEVFLHAQKVYFVSDRQRILTERRIVSHLNNAAFTWNPLNLSFPDEAISWPSHQQFSFAIVGGLYGNKGQDTAMEMLSRPEWQNRYIRITFK